MLIKIVWYDVFERKTLECVVADGNADWCICHALDQCGIAVRLPRKYLCLVSSR